MSYISRLLQIPFLIFTAIDHLKSNSHHSQSRTFSVKNFFPAETFRRPTPTSWEPSLWVEAGTIFITLFLGITKHLKCQLIGATYHLPLLTSLHGLVSEIFLKNLKFFQTFNFPTGWATDLKTVNRELVIKRARRTGDGSRKYDDIIGDEKLENDVNVWGWSKIIGYSTIIKK